jgi:hypothetical protein
VYVTECCGVGEASIDWANQNWINESEGCDFNTVIETILCGAVNQRIAFLIWNVTPHLLSNKKAEEIIQFLPNTTFVGENKNLKTGNVIRMYVTDLIKEW